MAVLSKVVTSLLGLSSFDEGRKSTVSSLLINLKKMDSKPVTSGESKVQLLEKYRIDTEKWQEIPSELKVFAAATKQGELTVVPSTYWVQKGVLGLFYEQDVSSGTSESGLKCDYLRAGQCRYLAWKTCENFSQQQKPHSQQQPMLQNNGMLQPQELEQQIDSSSKPEQLNKGSAQWCWNKAHPFNDLIVWKEYSSSVNEEIEGAFAIWRSSGKGCGYSTSIDVHNGQMKQFDFKHLLQVDAYDPNNVRGIMRRPVTATKWTVFQGRTNVSYVWDTYRLRNESGDTWTLELMWGEEWIKFEARILLWTEKTLVDYGNIRIHSIKQKDFHAGWAKGGFVKADFVDAFHLHQLHEQINSSTNNEQIQSQFQIQEQKVSSQPYQKQE
jgi:hypothetical protein